MTEKWDVSRRVTTLCIQRIIESSVLKGNMWLISENAKNGEPEKSPEKWTV